MKIKLRLTWTGESERPWRGTER